MANLTTPQERDETVLTLCKEKKFLTAAQHIQTWLYLEENEVQRLIDEAIIKLENEANDV